MKVSTSTGGVSFAGRGVRKSAAGGRYSVDGDPQNEDGETEENLPSLAAFGDRTPPRGSFVNILV